MLDAGFFSSSPAPSIRQVIDRQARTPYDPRVVEIEINLGGISVLLDNNKFVVKSQGKMFSSKKSFEIVEGETGQMLGSAKDTTGFFPSLLGSAAIEVRNVSNNALLFTVSRTGWLFKKDQILDAAGQVIARFKSKMFSLSGGFHVYDKDDKHIGELQGKLLKAEYKFVTPDKTTEMGSVSRTWGGLAKSLLSGADSYGVQIAPKFANDATVKMLILGAAIAVESIFKKEKGSKSASSWGGASSSGGGGDE